jgi:hypothetical protein
MMVKKGIQMTCLEVAIPLFWVDAVVVVSFPMIWSDAEVVVVDSVVLVVEVGPFINKSHTFLGTSIAVGFFTLCNFLPIHVHS